MASHPLAEVFGFPTDNFSDKANRYRSHRLCPFNNRVANCTKDKANDPLGVCSIVDTFGNHAITCPIRFRQDWLIVDDVASFFFPPNTTWTSLTEVRLNDKYGVSAGNIDLVLVSYDNSGHVTDFGSLEVQGVYISGNVRRPFEYYMEDPDNRHDMDWTRQRHSPRPDYLSSSRKRLVPQLIYKGGILKTWGKRMAVAIDQGFYETLPKLNEVDVKEADIMWLVYDLELNKEQNIYQLTLKKTIYTLFKPALDQITVAESGLMEDFIGKLQDKLDEKLDNEENPPDAPTLADLL